MEADDCAEVAVFRRRALAAPVRALVFHSEEHGTKHLFVGMGSQLSVYDVSSGNAARVVWEGEVLYPAAIWAIRLYGRGENLQVLVIGQKRACILSHKQMAWSKDEEHDRDLQHAAFTTSAYPPLYINWQFDFCDWVLDILPISASRVESLLPNCKRTVDDPSTSENGALGAYFVVGFAHNFVEIWEWKTRSKIYQTKSEPCILYSMSLLDDKAQSGTILATSGTMFSKILVWDIFAPSPVTPTYSLEGHEGVIFGTRWNEEGKILVSFSDDRSLRVWNLSHRAHRGSTKTQILSPAVSMHGHSERVWDACYLADQLIASVSEDSTCRIWDMRTGACFASLRGHQGRSAWRVSSDRSKSIIVTGGGDSAIRFWSIESAITRNRGGRKEVIEVPRSHLECYGLPSELQEAMARSGDFIRRLTLLGSNHLLIATDHGFVYRCPLSGDSAGRWSFVHKLQDGRGWEGMATSPTYQFAILGDDQGGLTLLDLAHPQKPIKWQAHEGKIRYIYWPHTDDSGRTLSDHEGELEFFTAGLVDSTVKLWKVGSSVIEGVQSSVALAASFCFPRGVSICAMAASTTLDIALCGDARGKVFLISLSDRKILQTINNAHGHDRVSDVVIRGAEGVYSTSCGRPGCLNRYSFSPNERKLVITNTIKMSRVLEGLERILFPKYNNSSHVGKTSDLDEELFLFGLRGADMVTLHMQTKCQSFQIDCGRSKRAWDLFYESSPDGPFTLVYHGMDKKIHFHSSAPVHDSTGVTELQSLGVPYHPRETNALQFLPRSFGNSKDETYSLVSCSVDTTCRLWRVGREHDSQGFSRLELQRTMREHSSTVRDITVQPSSLEAGATLLFSGGGHCSLHCWLIPGVAQSFSVHAGSLKKPGSDSRVMALDSAPLHQGFYVLISGTSTGDIDVILFDEQQRSFRILATLRGHASAILSVRLLPRTTQPDRQGQKEERMENDRVIFTSGGTDGKILFWDISAIVADLGSTTSAVTIHPFQSLDVHQSGVNALAVQQLGEGQDPSYALISGGDDQSLHLIVFALQNLENAEQPLDPEAERTIPAVKLTARIQAEYELTLAHASAVKGVELAGGYAFSTGPDQRLCVWKLLTQGGIKLQMIGAYFVDVADVAALHITPIRAVPHLAYLVAVAGVGLQLLEIDLGSRS